MMSQTGASLQHATARDGAGSESCPPTVVARSERRSPSPTLRLPSPDRLPVVNRLRPSQLACVAFARPRDDTCPQHCLAMRPRVAHLHDKGESVLRDDVQSLTDSLRDRSRSPRRPVPAAQPASAAYASASASAASVDAATQTELSFWAFYQYVPYELLVLPEGMLDRRPFVVEKDEPRGPLRLPRDILGDVI